MLTSSRDCSTQDGMNEIITNIGEPSLSSVALRAACNDADTDGLGKSLVRTSMNIMVKLWRAVHTSSYDVESATLRVKVSFAYRILKLFPQN